MRTLNCFCFTYWCFWPIYKMSYVHNNFFYNWKIFLWSDLLNGWLSWTGWNLLQRLLHVSLNGGSFWGVLPENVEILYDSSIANVNSYTIYISLSNESFTTKLLSWESQISPVLKLLASDHHARMTTILSEYGTIYWYCLLIIMAVHN